MKKVYSLLLLLLISTFHYTAEAQAPDNVNYQAIARDTAGNPLANTSLIVQLSLLSGSPSGSLVWQEKHTLSTNALGQFSLKLGTGLSTGSGSATLFAAINWGASSYFLRTEINAGSGFVVLGTDQLSSVPYALHAKTTSALPAGTTTGQVLSWNGTAWVPSSVCSLLNVYYRDNDKDGYGDSATTANSCFLPAGYVTNNDDCDDNNPFLSPNGIEYCNNIDDNCDGIIDNATTTIQNDPSNCGGCGFVCPPKPNMIPQCGSGICYYECQYGFGDCNNDLSDGCETYLLFNALNCSGCNVVCPSPPNASANCTFGMCTFSCNGSYSDCDGNPVNGCESDLATDLSNCGACGVVCSSQPNTSVSCTAGICTYTCNTYFFDCNNNMADGCEVNITSNTNNCGNCGVVCTAPNATMGCSNGICFITSCSAGFANCNNNAGDGCETNVLSEVNNCGGCGYSCPNRPFTTKSCSNGICTYVCTPGRYDCNLTMTDGCESTNPLCP